MKNIIHFLKKGLYYIIRIIIIFAFPPILIFAISYFTTKVNVKTPIVLINLKDGIKISEYILMYIGILGIEITAILTWVIQQFSISKENQEKNQKIKISRGKVYNDLTSSLQYLFELYRHDLFLNNDVINKSIFLSDNWEENLLNLNIDSKYIAIYRELYMAIYTIKPLKEEEKNIYLNLDNLFKKISLDFYYTYKKELDSDIKIIDIMESIYIQAIDKLLMSDNVTNKLEVKYANGELMYSKRKDRYTVYSTNQYKLCDCSFVDGKPYTGYVNIYNEYSHGLYYQGKIDKGIKNDGIFFDCELDEDDIIMIDDTKNPIYILPRFRSIKQVRNLNIMNFEHCKKANVKYKNNEYVVVKNTITEGEKSAF